MFRISVTTLEKFRRYLVEASPFDTEEALIESIKGIFKGNDKTRFGNGYHELLEGKYESNNDGIFHAGGYGFSEEQALPALIYRQDHPLMVHEISVNQVFNTNYGYIQVTGRVDGIEGIQVRDKKTKFREVKVQEYLDSFQWRFYLQMTGLDQFYYDVFEVQGFDQILKANPILNASTIYQQPIKILDSVAIHCERYGGMENDLYTLLNDFLNYIHTRGLLQFLKPAIPQPDLNF